MTRLLAIAELRIREGIAARLPWLVAVAFATGVATALWARGPDEATRAAIADRVVLAAVWGLAFAVAAIVPALGLPADVRTGAAQTLLSAPVSRLEVVAGGTLGYGALSTLLLVAMAAASSLGLTVGGVGAASREPLRAVTAPAASEPVTLSAASPSHAFAVQIPDGLAAGEPLRVRCVPAPRYERGWERATSVALSLRRPGGAAAERVIVHTKAGTAFTAHLPRGDLRAGDAAELVIERTSGLWKLLFGDGAIEIGGARRWYTWGLVLASLAAAPFLLLLAAVGSMGAARFGAPTAVVVAAFLFLVLAGRAFIADAARFTLRVATEPAAHVHDDGHGHAPPTELSPLRVAVARGAVAVFERLPRYEAFDLTESLVLRRAPGGAELTSAAREGLPAATAVVLVGWILFRRREIAPG